MMLAISMWCIQMASLAHLICASLYFLSYTLGKLPGWVGSSHTQRWLPVLSQPCSQSLIFASSLLMSWFLHRSSFASPPPAPLIREMRAIVASTLPPFGVDTGTFLVHLAIHPLGLSAAIALKGGLPGETNPTNRSESLYDLRH